MSDTFTASNGLLLCPNRDGSVRWEAGFSPVIVTQALREFFQHERDKELGRWRDPERPNIVVYPCEAERVAHVLDEKTAYSQIHAEGQMSEYRGDRADAVRAYFAAHPEPKPWHDAKPGEVWAIEHAAGGETVWSVSSDFTSRERTFRPVVVTDPNIVGMRVTAATISSARRIWPEVTP